MEEQEEVVYKVMLTLELRKKKASNESLVIELIKSERSGL